ncbi:TonB-dependent receptor plug domain-containing protein [Paracidovorax cattleyae]|uniref:TonB-dependent receptor plug domain-containing protein n=1 Tax=Paracidovorax cattleyae TaxID=80868 RepID=UPI001E419BC1|nr:TonB-dependent receptor plug domain-containing protein [Paracidovorax cattleyae]
MHAGGGRRGGRPHRRAVGHGPAGGAAGESGKGPGTGFVARSATGGAKTDTPLLETPQSVSAVARGQMDAQGATTLVESLRYTPGIVAQ